ncbi:BLUF domain-containing protein [Sphingomonas adhaesiva]|uniref:BLUF domain-containing protein n=1 Tax=Sphingomonas adhaesiva TaxID=28212 RepID=UPI002FF79796
MKIGGNVFRIIYASRVSRPLASAELALLCEVATDRNLADGITGLFLFDGLRFLQAIEGEREAVEATMGRIARDVRHHEIDYVQRIHVGEREFPRWSMQMPSDRTGTTFLETVKADVAQVRDPYLRAQFIGFAKLASLWRRRGEG